VRCHGGPVTGFCRSVIADLHLCTIWTSVWEKRCMLIHTILHDNVCFAHYPEMWISLLKWKCKQNSFEIYTASLQIFRGLYLAVCHKSFMSCRPSPSVQFSIQPFCMLWELWMVVIWHFCFNIWLSKCKGEWVYEVYCFSFFSSFI